MQRPEEDGVRAERRLLQVQAGDGPSDRLWLAALMSLSRS